MMKPFLLTTVFFLTIFTLQATDGYKIKVKIKGFEKDTIYLGYHYGEKQYLRDTTAKNAQGWFVFEGEKLLEPGMYLIVMPPDNKFFEILVNTDNQEFEVETSYDKPADEMKVKNSQDNQIFYDYLHFIASKRPEAEDLKKKIDEAGEDAAKKEPLEKKLEGINDEVKNYQQNLLKKYPASLTGAIIKGTFGLEYPEFKGTEEEINLQKWRYTVEHYFDNIDLRDDRLVRTSFLFQRIDYFVNKLTVQHPDSINRGLDYILEKMDPKGENFKFYLVHFLNTFAKSNIAGMDAVYVHLVKKYYEKGLATWTDEETMKKILDNANTLEPLLIGKIAPNIQMQKQDGTKLSLHDIQSPYTVMFFWDPECGHCKKAAPFLVEFDKKFKSKGVTIFSICTEFTEDVPKCWESIKEKEFTDFINVVDPYHRSKYKTIYDIKSTPQIYILDSKKEILMKKIGAEQLGEVMDQIIKMKNDSNTTNSMAKDSQGDKIGTSKSPNIEDKLHNSQRREIKMKKRESGTFEIPCKVNGLELNLILDTGASLVSISLAEAIFMLKNNYLREEDFLGQISHQIANGQIENGTELIIRKLQIGEYIFENIEASVVHNLEAPLLLGQSALSRFGKISIDYKTNSLVID